MKKKGKRRRPSAPITLKWTVPATIKTLNMLNGGYRQFGLELVLLLERNTRQSKWDIVYATPGDSMPCNFVYESYLCSIKLTFVNYGYGFTYRAASVGYMNLFQNPTEGLILILQCLNQKAQYQKSWDPKKHQLIFLDRGLPNGTELAYFSRRKEVLKGIKERRGIFCFCCKTEISPSEFEKHAGYESRRKPYENIFLLNGPVKGRSLSEYAYGLKLGLKQLDQLVCIGCCGLMHRECKYATHLPYKKRLCIYCRKPAMFVGRNNVVACVLCRAYDFSETGFNDRTAIICNQCEKEYHIGCLREYNKAHLKELPHGNWFCTVGCEKLYSDLEALATYGPHMVLDSDAEWIILHGKCASGGNKLLLDKAVKIFHECFNRILDPGTGKDIISSMAYGKEMGSSDFSRVHCAMLKTNSKVVTAGLFRFFGHEVAELPIVATRRPNQGKGYFRLFLAHFETLLKKYKIQKLVLPAAKVVQAMWIDKFGFNVVTPEQLSEYRQLHTAMMTFKGTTLLEKAIPEQLN